MVGRRGVLVEADFHFFLSVFQCPTLLKAASISQLCPSMDKKERYFKAIPINNQPKILTFRGKSTNEIKGCEPSDSMEFWEHLPISPLTSLFISLIKRGFGVLEFILASLKIQIVYKLTCHITTKSFPRLAYSEKRHSPTKIL